MKKRSSNAYLQFPIAFFAAKSNSFASTRLGQSFSHENFHTTHFWTQQLLPVFYAVIQTFFEVSFGEAKT